MDERLQTGIKILNHEARQVFRGSHVDPYFSGVGATSHSRPDIASVETVLMVKLITQEGKTIEYFMNVAESSHISSNQVAPFPEEETILTHVGTWLEEKQRFEKLSGRQKKIEELKSLVGMTKFQNIFEQINLKRSFEKAQPR